MCRMYGHHATWPINLAGVLLDADHSLLAQSRRDWRGESHADGWGLGYFEREQPRVVRRPTPAVEDAAFPDAARSLSVATAIAHVRQASVGDRSVANTHPFTFGRWIFVHNGTVTGFDKVLPSLVAETDADLRQQIGGTTDSEHIFYWLLSGLRRAGHAAAGPCEDVHTVARVVAEGIRTLAARSAAARPAELTRLNFLLTDGVVFLASRWKHTLFWIADRGPVGAGEPRPAGGRRGVAVASEPIGPETWAEVPEGQVMTIDRDFVVRWLAI